MAINRFLGAARLAVLLAAGLGLLGPGAAPAAAEATRPATVRVTVLDPSGAVIIGAVVEVREGDRVVASAVTGDRGTAELPGLAPRATETTARLRRALDDVDALVRDRKPNRRRASRRR